MQKKEELIYKLFHDQCSRKELDMLFEWIKKDPSDIKPKIMQQLFQQMEEICPYGETVFDRIRERIAEETRAIEPKIKPIQTSWKTGMLEFENASILEILNTLSEANDTHFEFGEETLPQEKQWPL